MKALVLALLLTGCTWSEDRWLEGCSFKCEDCKRIDVQCSKDVQEEDADLKIGN